MRWLLFTTTELEQPLWRMARHSARYPPDKRLPAEAALAREEFAAMARVIEERMNGRTFVVGNTVPVIPVKAASSPALPRDQMG